MKTDLSMYQVTVGSISCQCCVDLDMQLWAWSWGSCILGQELRCSSNDWGWVSHPSLAREVWASGLWAGWGGRGMLGSPSQRSAVPSSSSGAHRQALFRKNQRIQPETFGLLRQSFEIFWTYDLNKETGQNLFLCCASRKNRKQMLSKSFHVNQSVGQCPVGRWGWKHFCSKHKLNLTVPSDMLIQRKSTLNLNMDMKIEDVHLFPWITSAFLFILAGNLHKTHFPLLSKIKQEIKDSWEMKS